MKFERGEWRTEEAPREQVKPVERTAKNMVAVLPFIEKELGQVESFLKRSHALCGQIPRTIYLMPFKGIDTTEIRKVAETAFTQVGFILDSEGITSDWQGREAMRSAAGPNSLFRQATWHFYLKKIGPWLWLEPDCWPLTDRWFYDLEREYFDAAKPFYGVKMATSDGREYLNGVGIYPWNAVQYAPLLVQASTWTQHPEMEVGFDIAGGQDVLNKAHITRKIQLVSHLARGNVAVRADVVLCHGRIDLSGGLKVGNEVPVASTCQPAQKPLEDLGSGQSGLQPEEQKSQPAPCPKPFLDGHGDGREVRTEVFEEAPHAAPCVPSHETPVQEPSISEKIRIHVQGLIDVWDSQPHRKVMIVKELRKAKLVPKHFR